jgi:NAD(P)-dependent dehydrogenase (short-subunit alcohol dehydrogenase family)
MTRAVGAGMCARGRGSIVNVTSNSALSGEAAQSVAYYGGTKAEQAATGTLPSVQSQPLRRIGRPEDIAWITLFLASARTVHLTGQLVSVSDGAWMP